MQEKSFDKNSIIGIVVICAILVFYSLFTQPSKEELAQMQRQRDSIAALQPDTVQAMDSLAHADTLHATPLHTLTPDTGNGKVDSAEATLTGILGNNKGEEKFFLLENENMEIRVSNKGGRIFSVRLKNYSTWDSKPLEMINGEKSVQEFNFFANNRSVSTGNLFFKPMEPSGVIVTDSTQEISLRLNEDEDSYLQVNYKLRKNSYRVEYSLLFNGMENVIASNTSYVGLKWNMEGSRQERNVENERMVSTIYYKFADEETDYLSESEDDEITIQNRIKWVAFKQSFFTAALIAGETFDKPTYLETRSEKEKTDYVKQYSAELTIPVEHKPSETFSMSFYFGPNHVQLLKSYEPGLENVVPLGWGIFGWVNRYFIIPVFNFLNRFISNYGLIILVLTLIIKVVLLPLTYKTYISQAKMKVLKPEMDVLNEKFPKTEDAMKKQQATMELYRKAGVNPMGGCLPVLFQMPILIAMFRFFPASIELRQQKFLWANDLSSYDSILDLPFNIPFYGDHVSLFTILMTVTTILYTWLNQQMTPMTGQMAQMKWMMYFMPLMFLGIFNNYSAALSYYYFLVNITSFAQQYLFMYFVDNEEIKRKMAEQRKKPVKKSGFHERLEKMAKARGLKMPK